MIGEQRSEREQKQRGSRRKEKGRERGKRGKEMKERGGERERRGGEVFFQLLVHLLLSYTPMIARFVPG